MIFGSADKSGQKARASRIARDVAWRKLIAKLEERFRLEAQARLDAGYFDQLYVFSSVRARTAQLTLGNRSLGANPQNPNQHIVEDGAALVVSKSLRGEVAVFLYPCVSSGMTLKEKYLVWEVYDSPAQFTSRKIERAITDFFLYIDVSSADLVPSKWAMRRIDAIRKRQHRYTETHEKSPASVWRSLSKPWAIVGGISGISTLLGVTVFQLWDIFFPLDAAERAMPVIAGHYTFCPGKASFDADAKLANLLYDIHQNAKKTVFLDLRIIIECQIGAVRELDWATFMRRADEASVTYSFHIPYSDKNDKSSQERWLDGKRTIEKLNELLVDNGSDIQFHGGSTGRNGITRFQLNREGIEDVFYGPYQIKVRVDDAAVTYDLAEPNLDARLADAAAKIDEARIAHHIEMDKRADSRPRVKVAQPVSVDAGPVGNPPASVPLPPLPVTTASERSGTSSPNFSLPPLPTPLQRQGN